MSMFCVFGVAMTHCIARARRSTPTKSLTPDEWMQEVTKRANALFEGGAVKPRAVSCELSTPSFCRDFIAVAAPTGQIRNMVVMCKAKKKDKYGKEVVRKGRPVLTWVPYEGGLR